MARVLFHLAPLVCCLLACGNALAQPAPDRASILAERKRLEAVFNAEQAQCSQRFAVTACVDDVRQRRRQALAVPRAQELALDDAERRQRADARREAVARKQRTGAERPVVAAEPARETRLPPAPAAGVAQPHERKAPSPDEARKRVAAAQERRDKVRAGQERIEARQAERARLKKPSVPLPVPGAASAAR